MSGIPRYTPLLLVLLLIGGCTNRQTYDVRGRVAGFGDDGRTLIVEHEDVPGLMPAMTMPFTVSDTTDLSSLSQRDAVSFTLVLAGDSSWVRNVRILPDTAVVEHPAGRASLAAGSAPPILEVGDAVPETTLMTHADTTLQLQELQGKAVVLTFIYTQCPMPQFCPLMSQRFAALQPQLQERYGNRVHLLSVSFDPKNDTPEVLENYALRYTNDLTAWTFATADSAEISHFAQRFGEFFTEDSSEIIHNLVTVLIGPNGRVAKFWRGNDWTTDDVLASIDELDLSA